ncbi:MAG: hypothetical protein AAGC92_11405 [Pseudomonadota bacterium]
MTSFLDVLIRVGSDPMAWAVLAVMAIVAAGSLYKYWVCPLAKANVPYTTEEARSMLNRRVRHPVSYLLVMLLGMGFAIAGLFGLAKGDHKSTLGFLSLAFGLYVILTLPVRLQIKDAELKVIASAEGEPRAIMAGELRQTHRRLMSYELVIFALFAAILLLF